MTATILSILMLAGFALGAGGVYFIAKKHDPKRGWLMIVAAMVMFGNVAIMVMPTG
jgi:peptidoglycan/LPS O-acetylase OafA/YrhL